jgi:hypothetical protein
MRQEVSAKEIAESLLRFTVGEPSHRQIIISGLSMFDESQRARIRDEILFLDVVVFGNPMQTKRVKQYWQESECVFVEFLASLGEIAEIGGCDSNGQLISLEAREAAYKEALAKPLNVARYAVAETFSKLCGFENESSVEFAGMGEFVSAVNYVGDLLTRYKIALPLDPTNSQGSVLVRWFRRFRWPFK